MALESQNMHGLVLFSHINRLGSLSAAAQLLGISRSSVSKQLAALEGKIGSRLFNRTTRKIVLTEVGRQVLQEAYKVELALQTIEHISEDSQSVIAGDLNVTCASAQGRVHLVPLITKFLAHYPKVNVNLQLDDRFVDMVAANLDVSIRIGYLPDSTLIARKLGDLSGVLCASPKYLSNAPPLQTPADLLHHRCLFYRNSKLAMNAWSFISDEGEESVTVSGPLSINDPGALISAALAHAGVLLIDKGLLGDTIQDGQLVPILPGYRSIQNLPMYVVYPEKEFIPAKTRALVDFLLEEMPAAIQGE
ncbi:LysR family transcriptional regulator [Pseudomonadales bacterium]|jgi:LysR family transcriptional activator of dmlA|nr:LysR family transcriptional regulator [Pseudomonadales bacterium]MDA9285776.1 LysR family transcriptional regulator [Pseudomonadales bacterium]MDA9298102.1 LysR family transcriptional regulator [Pseudomonadales bacterium]MDB4068863.1 LysR family transcriptional regulator [Pseudomonadales bacterium]MDB9868789.1 LysR family transcriptional regulator [Pseudomonadales bacterium]